MLQKKKTLENDNTKGPSVITNIFLIRNVFLLLATHLPTPQSEIAIQCHLKNAYQLFLVLNMFDTLPPFHQLHVETQINMANGWFAAIPAAV